MKIEAEIKSLKKIFTDDETFYQIPDYQRPYSWDKENISELVDDLINSYRNDQDIDYFCGSIVLVKNGRLDVIDGQQRLTTFTIMSCVLRDLYFEQLGSRAKDYVLSSIQDKYDTEKRKLKFLTNEQYQIDFEMTILRKIEFSDSRKIEKEFPQNRYLQNAHYFKIFLDEKFSEHTININDFVIWLFEKVVLTVITTPDQDNAIRIFNVLNDRGMPLSPMDILKSSLMTRLTGEDRRAFKIKWENINNNLKITDQLTFEDMLNTYLYYKIATNPSNRLDKELIAVFERENKSPIETIVEIGRFSDSYLAALNSNDKYLYMLKYLQHRIYWHSIITTAHFLGYEDIDRLKKYLVAYYYQNWISGATIARIKQTSFNILRAIKLNRDIDEIICIMKDNLDYYNTTAAYKDELDNNNIYGRKWDKPLLLLIEYFLPDDSKNNFIPLDNKLQIEHILPRKSDNENADWQTVFTENEREELINSLGNLTLLSMRKNIQANNYSFSDKKTAYENKDSVITSFIMTRHVLTYDKWDKESILHRKNDMLSKINARLDLF